MDSTLSLPTSTSNAVSGQKGRTSRRTSEESSGFTSPRPEATQAAASEAPAASVVSGRRPSISQGGKGPKAASSQQQQQQHHHQQSSQASSKNVSLFAHLPQFDRSAILAPGTTSSISSHLLKGCREADIHPAIIRLGLAYADYSIIGASERCRQMLLAFKQVFMDYQAPPDQAISRHLESHLRPLIAFLVNARPLAIAMGHAIRHLKLKISTLPPDTTELEAKEFMCAVVDNYLRNRIDLSDQLIAHHGGTKIADGDVILTFAHSAVVAATLIRAHSDGKKFRVVVTDSRPFLEGRKMLKRLVDAGIDCTYLHMNSVGHVMKEVTKVFLGAHALFSNGALMSRVGTATVALLAKNANKPVIVCCETLKFSEHLQLDSIVYNEVGDADAIVTSAARHSTSKYGRALGTDWRSQANLKLLNVLYDVTPPEFISLVISEIGLIPVTSIPVVLREYNSASNSGGSGVA